MKPLDDTTLNLILYFINKLDGILGRTHLQKMLFLTDLLAVKNFQQPITKIEYKRYKHGPYSQQLNEYVSALEKDGFIETKKLEFINDSSKKYYRFHAKKPIDIRLELISKLGPEKVLMIDEVVNSFGNLSLQEVLDIVYSLEIIKKSEMNKPLEMAKSLKAAPEEEPHAEDAS